MVSIFDRRQRLAFPPRDSMIIQLRTGWSRAVVFTLMWWIFTDGVIDSWQVGVPVVLLATLVSVALLPRVTWSLSGIARFAPFFLWQSLRGGADVAWRAFHPGMPIAPAVVDYPLRLPPGLPQVMLANIVSLLPGTLSATLDGLALKVHVLDSRGEPMIELKALEHRVARMSGVLLATSHGGEVDAAIQKHSLCDRTW